MKVIGFVPIHYGCEYLQLCLESLLPIVDKIVVAYTKKPSHGHDTDAVCPDTEEQIKSIAESICSSKLIWHSANSYRCEAEHRSIIYKFSSGYDMVITLDSDEVANTEEALEALKVAYKSDKRNHGVNGYVNFWRSFDYVVHDSFRPIRIFNLNNESGQDLESRFTIYHFGVCQNPEIMKYKYLIHGHKDELRPDWLNSIYFKWTLDNKFDDLHPAAFGIWNATPFDKSKLPDNIKAHPNFNKLLV